MKITIESITVNGFRGIPGEETFTLKSDHSVFVGPNGTGKSTITQALEFLLTSQVSALTGSGAGRINKNEHIPNRQADPTEVFVEAEFADEAGSTFSARREFTSQSSVKSERRPEEFRRLLDQADQSLTLLTRDELLNLVVTTPGKRKDQLQELLDLTGIDERRRQLKRLRRNANSETDTYQREIERSTETIKRSLGINRPDEKVILAAVNDLRSELGGEPLEDLQKTDSFSEGVSPPAEQATHPLQRANVRDTIDWLSSWLADDVSDFHSERNDVAELLSALQADTESLERVSQIKLIKQGQKMITEETDTCPLCLADWKTGEVNKRLEARRRRLDRIERRTNQVRKKASKIRQEADAVASRLDRLRDALDENDVETSIEPLMLLHGHMTNLLSTFDVDLVDKIEQVSPNDFNHHIDTTTPLKTLESLSAEADSLPSRSALQEVWDSLTEVTDAYETLTEASAKQAEYERVANELGEAHEQFLKARDGVLEDIYDSIAERFADFYTRINPDEDEMVPALDPTNTGVEFSVGFYDDAGHPPHALHSEGHQDSMGVCLFLALADHFSPLDRTPVMLDDVVMSVDQSHRERVAAVLAKELSDDFQFIITTHDDRWARELVQSGLVEPSNVHAFEDWSPQQGPQRTTFVQ
ncbi:AAA family ATPase [Halorubrum sp. RMP-47]|uniref:AAA family ATPase n=1 Tax=Halorubrum miltondacostae TaxID=3076378 RepID=UPI003528EC2C